MRWFADRLRWRCLHHAPISTVWRQLCLLRKQPAVWSCGFHQIASRNTKASPIKAARPLREDRLSSSLTPGWVASRIHPSAIYHPPNHPSIQTCLSLDPSSSSSLEPPPSGTGLQHLPGSSLWAGSSFKIPPTLLLTLSKNPQTGGKQNYIPKATVVLLVCMTVSQFRRDGERLLSQQSCSQYKKHQVYGTSRLSLYEGIQLQGYRFLYSPDSALFRLKVQFYSRASQYFKSCSVAEVEKFSRVNPNLSFL